MTDYINRETVLRRIEEMCVKEDDYAPDVAQAIYDFVADMDTVEVVRCKDCQLYSKHGNWCDWHMSIVHDLDFCSLAERRDDDGRRFD